MCNVKFVDPCVFQLCISTWLPLKTKSQTFLPPNDLEKAIPLLFVALHRCVL